VSKVSQSGLHMREHCKWTTYERKETGGVLVVLFVLMLY